MLVSYKWLQDYVDIDVTPDELGKALTMAGITVDLVHYPTAHIKNVVVGKIEKIEPHPDADRLRICFINVGEEVLQIVTGAQNVQDGHTVPVALVGAKLADGTKISKGKLRGVVSYGMLCSEKELGLADESAGVWILDDSLTAGTDVVKEFFLDDAVLELDLTPNRSDCMSIINVAREVAAIYDREIRMPEYLYTETAENIADLASIEVKNTKLCPRYTARMIKDVKIAPSPYWMQHYLRTAGIRPINNVVDVSNFVLLEMGQPLHTFDYDKIGGASIIVRNAEAGEKIITLDEKERVLDETMLMICDNARPMCVAGIMGGMDSGISDTTENILLESAGFLGVNIRHSAKKLGLRSESSARFEKGIDFNNLEIVSRRATYLLVNLCGGKAVSGVIDSNPVPIPNTVVFMRPERVNTVLGLALSEAEIIEILRPLKFPMEKVEGGYNITIPSHRLDITEEVDMVEEVARLWGFDKIPTKLPSGAMTDGVLTPKQKFMSKVTSFAIGNGFKQVMNYGFVGVKEWDKLEIPADSSYRKNIEIMNPLNEDQKVMRTLLLPGLLKNAAYNQKRRMGDLLLFEQGSTFDVVEGEKLPAEPKHLTMLALGSEEKSWLGKGKNYDYFYIKGILENFIDKFGVEDCKVRATADYSFLHPGRGAEIFIGEKKIGYIGELHPNVVENYELSGRPVVLDLLLDEIFGEVSLIPKYSSIAKFPTSSRDMAILASTAIATADIQEAIYASAGKYLSQVKLFDVYKDEKLGAGMCSLAYGLEFKCDERTLTDEEVNEAFAAILSHLKEKFDISLRM